MAELKPIQLAQDTDNLELADALALVQRIHQELELAPLLDLLLAYASALAPVTALEFALDDIEFASGRVGQGAHRFAYELATDDQPLGTITASSRRRLDDAQLEQIEDLFGLAVTAIANAVRYHNASNQARTTPKRVRNDAIILLALDGFETLQEGLGSAQAQDLMNDLGVLLRDNLRDADDVYQIDDGDLAILLPHTSEDNATALAEKLRILIQARSEELALEGVFITPTLGIASTRGAKSAEEVLSKARAALQYGRIDGPPTITH